MTTTTTEAPCELVNAILVYEKDGKAVHGFFTERYATEFMASAQKIGLGASMFSSELDAAAAYTISPGTRSRVEAAKRKLSQDLAIRDTLTRHGIPEDYELRVNVYKAIMELRETIFRPI